MVTIYVMLILWAGAEGPDKTHMVYGSKAACEDAITYQALSRGRQIKEATCTPRTVRRGVPIEISEGLIFTPD
jgi:hypothetical protein